MAQPESLANLSLEALGKYACSLTCHLVVLPFKDIKYKKRKNRTTDFQILVKTCRKFHKMIVENIPVTLANEVTNKLLSYLDNMDTRFDTIQSITFSEYVFKEIAKSIVHPAVTRIEPEHGLLDCSDIFSHNSFKNTLLTHHLLKVIDSLTNLKVLNIRNSMERIDVSGIKFSPYLEEFCGECNDEGLEKLANSCKYLRSLDLCSLRDITNASIPTILKMTHLQKLNIAHTSFTSDGITVLLNALVEKGEASKLKCLVFSKYTPQHLRILENLPNLKVSLQHDYYTFFLTLDIFKMSDLYSLKNLHGLEITSSLRDLNDLLREIGHQLVFLEVTIEIIDVDEQNNVTDASDMLLIGQYCKKLRCLHISGTVYGFPSMKNYTRRPLPGFQTITCLKLEVESGEKSVNTSPHKDLLYFLISQCVNIKKLTVPVDVCFFGKYELMCSVIQADFMKNVEEVYFKLCCCECTFEDAGDMASDHDRDNEVVQMLIDHCPKLRVVGGVPGLNKRHHHNLQRLKFFTDLI